MIISRTTSGQIVSGTVLKWKPGSGSAADRLTILTIVSCLCAGEVI